MHAQLFAGVSWRAVKRPSDAADIWHMIISDNEARLVAKSIRENGCGSGACAHDHVPAELLEAARAAASQAPELRTERIEHARSWLGQGDVDAHAVAEKMMCRIMSDWMR